VTRTVGWALAAACLTGIGTTWLGILLAYDSYYWGAGHHSLPVSFFIVALIFAGYLLSGLPAARVAAGRREPAGQAAASPGRDQIAA